MNRRTFLRQTAVAAGVTAIAPLALIAEAQNVGVLAVDHNPALSGVMSVDLAAAQDKAGYYIALFNKEHEVYMQRHGEMRRYFE